MIYIYIYYLNKYVKYLSTIGITKNKITVKRKISIQYIGIIKNVKSVELEADSFIILLLEVSFVLLA